MINIYTSLGGYLGLISNSISKFEPQLFTDFDYDSGKSHANKIFEIGASLEPIEGLQIGYNFNIILGNSIRIKYLF